MCFLQLPVYVILLYVQLHEQVSVLRLLLQHLYLFTTVCAAARTGVGAATAAAAVGGAHRLVAVPSARKHPPVPRLQEGHQETHGSLPCEEEAG